MEIYLSNNSSESIARLKESGYDICPCCTQVNAIWLHYDEKTKTFHGLGQGCELECKKKSSIVCLTCQLMEDFKEHNHIIFNNVDDLLDYLKPKKKKKNIDLNLIARNLIAYFIFLCLLFMTGVLFAFLSKG